MLFIEGCIVTIDAMGTQKKIIDKIVNDNKADYVVALKGNQGLLHEDVKDYFIDLQKEKTLDQASQLKNQETLEIPYNERDIGIYRTLEKGHGRNEDRTYYYSTHIDWLYKKDDWRKLTGIGMVIRKVDFEGEESKNTTEVHFYIGSVSNVEDFAYAVRNHWGVESMHWSLDVTFGDDKNRTRKGKAPQNLAVIKRLAFNAIKNETQKYPKESMKGKRFFALMDYDYRDYLIDLNLKEG